MTGLDTASSAPGGVRFLGTRGAYWRLLIRGAALLMVTLGIYRFWLITDVRRFLWANSEVAGETLEYTGRPVEILIGFLVAVAILAPVYAGFFIAALDLGTLGQMSGAIAFLGLAVLGQYAIYRARRYRLTRTIFRGLRFHQGGSAWGYALRAVLWWALTGLTLGLAYPFQLASLERYKMRHTYYGDLQGRFEASGFRLLLRGLPMWLMLLAPLALAVVAFAEAVDWKALGEAIAAGTDSLGSRIEGGNPQLPDVIVFAMLMGGTSASLAALLYPAFQAVILRWWLSGLRFGDIALASNLHMRNVYGAYVRFLWYGLLLSIALGLLSIPALMLIGTIGSKMPDSIVAEAVGSGVALVGYVVMALGFSTVYRATVLLSLWQLGMESLHLSGLSALERVQASGTPSSAVGEGLADALHVGGY